MLLCWVVGRWYQSVSQRWVSGLVSKVQTLRKKFREARFECIMNHIWGLIKDYKIPELPPPIPVNENTSGRTPAKPTLTEPTKQIELPAECKECNKWRGSVCEFLKFRLGISVSAKYVHWQTLRAFLRRIRDYGTYEFSGNAKIFLPCINPVEVIVETFGQFGISVDEQTVLEIMQDLIPRQWAGMMLNFEHSFIRKELDKKLSKVVDAVYEKICVSIAA